MLKILFVCTGNTCRSPMAAAIAGDLYKNRRDFSFYSRGISVSIPSRASDNAIATMKIMMGISLSTHVSRQISGEDMEEAVMILTMTSSHKTFLKEIYVRHAKKIFTIKEICGQDGDIPDPYGGSLPEYKACADNIKKCLGAHFSDRLDELLEKEIISMKLNDIIGADNMPTEGEAT